MVRVTVRKVGGPFNIHDTYTINTKDLGKTWCSFFLQSAFCRITMYRTRVNNTAKMYVNRFVYVVEANNRRMIYDANYNMDNPEYKYVKDFVNYVLDEHKYKKMVV